MFTYPITQLKRRAQTALWTPSQLSTIAWWDAKDAATVTVATGVSQWNDKSGNSYHMTQLSASAQPTYITGEYVDYNDVGGLEKGLTINQAIFNTGTGHCVFMVVEPSAAYTSPPLFTEAAGEASWLVFAGNNHLENIGFSSRNSATLPSVNKGIYGVRAKSASTTDLQLNANTPYYVAGYGGGYRTLIVNPSTGFYNRIKVFEVIVTGELSDTNFDKMNGYLAHRHGLASLLPAAHPFKSAPPTL